VCFHGKSSFILQLYLEDPVGSDLQFLISITGRNGDHV